MNFKLNVKNRSVRILVFVNLLPLLGVVFFGWDVLMLVIFYCYETFIIGIFNVIKIILSKAEIPKKYFAQQNLSDNQFSDLNSKKGCLKSFMVPFFIVHYNGFVIIQTIMIYFISIQFSEIVLNINSFLSYDFIINMLLIIGSHAYSFKKNFLDKKKYNDQSVIYLMFLPYKRVIIQQFTVLVGTFFLILFQGPIGFLILLIGLKIFFDVRAHNKYNGEEKSLVDEVIDYQKENYLNNK